jgi:hypothetical protein
VLLLVAPLLGAASVVTDSEKVLARSIDYHDPEGLWGREPLRLSFEESRPDGSMRKTKVLIDSHHERFEWWSESGDDILEGSLVGEECTVRLNGSIEIPNAKREKHRLDCQRVILYRDYYTYLWGLPMKLRDPGTRLGPEIRETDFHGQPVLSLRVNYDPEVGGDTWYFYFDPDSAALVGYRFYHDEAANDGEYIVLEGEVKSGSLRLPKARTWYTHGDERLLGTDTLIAFTPLPRD